jgi:hypothetical protein
MTTAKKERTNNKTEEKRTGVGTLLVTVPLFVLVIVPLRKTAVS